MCNQTVPPATTLLNNATHYFFDMTDSLPLSKLLDKRPLIFTALPLRDSRTGDPEHDRKILRNINARKDELAR